jgi:spore coat protein A
MYITRREFILKSSLTAAALATKPLDLLAGSPARRMLNPNGLAHFVDPLPVPKIADPTGYRSAPEEPKRAVPYYRISLREFSAKLHRDLRPTRQWGFASTVPGPTFDTRRGQGLMIEWANDLPPRHFLPIDHNLHGAEANLPETRTVVHVHGAKAPPDSDGYPENWFTPGKSAIYYYPNDQEAATLWYHDHAMGINRLNIYAGLSGFFLVRDEAEAALNLPSGAYEIPLMLSDRLFDEDGQLYYPTSGKPDAPWVPEVNGNIILANGKIFPYLEVEPRAYRFRLLNGSNTRALPLSLSNGMNFQQIGSDQGLLGSVVDSDSLTLFPAERADLIIDFKGNSGQRIVLGSRSVEIMQFQVRDAVRVTSVPWSRSLRKVNRIAESAAVKIRALTLNDYYDYNGNSMMMLLNGAHWNMPVTEKPVIDTVEIWRLINLTRDAHPIHLHLVRFQILDRRRFDLFTYNLNHTVKYLGPAMPPDENEKGWKDTVRADPGMETRIIMRFEGYAGRYVWHCHLLEHEDNEMMRPYEVIGG